MADDRRAIDGRSTPRAGHGSQGRPALVVWSCCRLLGSPDIERSWQRFPHQFSGGQRQRIIIALALACDPKVLLCDEPTTALDVTVQAQVSAVLRDLQQQRGIAMLLVSHDLAVIATCQRVGVMYAGRLVEAGACQTVLSQPRHPYTQALAQAAPDVATKAQLPPPVIAGQPPLQRAPWQGCALRRAAPIVCPPAKLSYHLSRNKTAPIIGVLATGCGAAMTERP